MKNRRHFLKGSIIGGTALATAPLSFIKDLTSAEGVPYELRLEVADKFFTARALLSVSIKLALVS